MDISIRSLRDDDVAAAQLMAYHSLRNAGLAYGWETPELDDTVRDRGRRRMRHAIKHDPDGAFAAVRDGEIVGVSLATRRGPMWFLSLLAVATDVALEARLSLKPGGSRCLRADDAGRAQVGPLSPYLPSGLWG